MDNYLQFDFETGDTEQSDKLIALLSVQGFEGFEESGDSLQAYIPEHNFNEEAFNELKEFFPSFSYTKTVIPQINWNQKWEQEFEPVLVNDFVGIRAGFHQPITNVEQEIIITPKMSFGTGHHATTHLVIEQMQSVDFKNKSVLDFGTGTGVLAILAEKLGARKVVAIDNDEWSIINAKENIELNGCHNIIVDQFSSIPEGEKYDVILANINLNVIVSAFSTIAAAMASGATLIMSGFLSQDEPVIIDNIQKNNLQYVATSSKNGWIMVVAQRND